MIPLELGPFTQSAKLTVARAYQLVLSITQYSTLMHHSIILAEIASLFRFRLLNKSTSPQILREI